MDVDVKHIRQKPKLIDALPGIGRGTCHAIYPNVYLSRKDYKNIIGSSSDPYSEAVVIHEQEHLRRMKQYGVAKWYTRYAFSRKFRLDEEVAAIKPQWAYIKAKELTVDIERKARLLSGWLYFWAEKYDIVLARLTSLWRAL